MTIHSLKKLIQQALSEAVESGRETIQPTWIAERAMQLADPDHVADAIPLVALAATMEFRQLAREEARHRFEPTEGEGPNDEQHELFPGLQKHYPRKQEKDADPEYVAPELLTRDDVLFNLKRLKSNAAALLRNHDSLLAWAVSVGKLQPNEQFDSV